MGLEGDQKGLEWGLEGNLSATKGVALQGLTQGDYRGGLEGNVSATKRVALQRAQ